MSASTAASQLSRELEHERDEQRQRDADVLAQLRAIKAELATDRRIGDDRHETLNRKLDDILRVLTTNGSGHGRAP